MQTDLFVRDEVYDFEAGDITPTFVRHVAKQGLLCCDLETSGLDWKSQRIGLVQLFSPGSEVFVFKPTSAKRPERLLSLIQNQEVRKIFHHAMFDLRFMAYHWSVSPQNIACTKIASKILDPDKKSHSLAPLLREHLGVEVDKSYQKSDWLSWDLSELQLAYAKADVISLPDLLDVIMSKLREVDRAHLAEDCFKHLPIRLRLELGGFGDVFAY